jgi:hypothetical protein
MPTYRQRTRPGEGRQWPTTRSDVVLEFDRREAAYLGDAYTEAEATRHGLFLAKDASTNRVLIPPRRITADATFVVDVDVAAILTDGVSLRIREDASVPAAIPRPDSDPEELRRALADADDEREQWRVLGQSVWDRSHVTANLEEWARLYCLGRVGFWVVRRGGRAHIVAMDPRTFVAAYDDLGINVESVTVDYDYWQPEQLDPDTGQMSTGEWVNYKALIGPDSIREWQRGARTNEDSDTNTLGAVPFVEVDYGYGPDGMPLWSGHGLEDGVAAVDSLFTQGLAIGGRHANPILNIPSATVEGDGLDNGPDLQGAPGRVLEGAEASWLEASLQGATFLTELAATVRTAYQQTVPAFVFLEAGANASGVSLGYRGSFYVMQATPMRNRFYRALATAIAIGVAMDRGMAWSPSLDVFECGGGAIIPADIAQQLGLIIDARDHGLLTPTDAVARSQEMGITPDHLPPEEYLERVQEENKDAQRRAAEVVAGMRSDDGGPTAPDGEGGPLLVGQINAAVSIVQQVAAGALPRESGLVALQTLVGLSPEEASRLMGEVGQGFTPNALPGTLRQVEDAVSSAAGLVRRAAGAAPEAEPGEVEDDGQ